MTQTSVEHSMENDNNIYDEKTLNILEERREEYLKGNSKGFTVEESMKHVKKELKKRGL